jgi:hypothetical protein
MASSVSASFLDKHARPAPRTEMLMETLTGMYAAYKTTTQAYRMANRAYGWANSLVGIQAPSPAMLTLSMDETQSAGKQLLSNSVSGAITWSASAWILQLLLKAYQQHRSSKSDRSASTGAQWDAWVRAGGRRSPEDTASGLSLTGTRVTLVVLGFTAQYLHALGAYEMRRKLRADAEARPALRLKSEKTTTASASQMPTPTAEGARDFRAHMAWQAIESLHAQNTHNTPGTAMDLLLRSEEDADEPGWLNHWVRQLYERHPFYLPTEGDGGKTKPDTGAYFTLTQNDPVRVLINLLLGFSLQMNSLFASGATMDPVAAIARLLSFVAYWEVFAQALRLYGLSPLYTATRAVMGLLQAAPVRRR